MAYPDIKQATDVCKLGQGEACCRYLTMSTTGWSCEKKSPMGRHLDARAAAGTMTARADNCDGMDSR